MATLKTTAGYSPIAVFKSADDADYLLLPTTHYKLLTNTMSLTRQQKEASISDIQENVKSAVSIVFISYDKLTVAEVSELRANLAEAGGGMRVIPKRLLKIALHNANIDFDPAKHEGQMAVVWGDDAVAPAKTLNTFASEHEDKIQLLAGILENNILNLEEVTALSKLPTRQQLLGQLASVLAGPTRGLVTVLSGTQRGLVQSLQAIVDQKTS